ncbi:sensor histidine kinase [Nocardia sp. CNY236]|uniref:sensor histidine kinase n=1 Tax=Nocardia sp. CNY236 TaxID=1169152 RepID=UPI001E57FF91|nr:sensor histidine kinase [Nocardia sp. CNY236]
MIMSVTASVVLFTITVVSLALIPIGIGLFTTPVVLTALRGYTARRRLLAAKWSDVRILTPYRRMPADLRGGFVGQVKRCALMLKDPATWREILWLPVDTTAGCVTALLPAALIVYPFESLVLAAGLWRLFTEGGAFWYGPVAVDSQGTALLAVSFGLVIFQLAVRYNTPLLRVHFALTKSLLGPTNEMTLAQRVDHLTETRHDAVDSSAAELRRIERDLHDGAQARLVAMGMNLGAIEALVEKDPAQAKKLLAMARESSAEALTELRDLVRGIHPPVLAERGLGDAVRALALRLPIETEVTVDLPRRADAPVESAAYFAVSEVLTNAVKHSEADRVFADIHHTDGILRISVTDNGYGGAAVGAGSGLSGIERRLGTFDGILAVSSPAGGPTMVTMEIPCELS